jgi:hypothetical protein
MSTCSAYKIMKINADKYLTVPGVTYSRDTIGRESLHNVIVFLCLPAALIHELCMKLVIVKYSLQHISFRHVLQSLSLSKFSNI